MAKHRSEICRLNACGLYDKNGTAEATILKGSPACGGCGCNEYVKTHSLSSSCYLKDLGRIPLWDSIMTQEEEDAFRKRTGLKNE